jgi:hypothetical protein
MVDLSADPLAIARGTVTDASFLFKGRREKFGAPMSGRMLLFA